MHVGVSILTACTPVEMSHTSTCWREDTPPAPRTPADGSVTVLRSGSSGCCDCAVSTRSEGVRPLSPTRAADRGALGSVCWGAESWPISGDAIVLDP